MNRAFFNGRLFGPVEIRYTQSNVPCASFNLGVCDRYMKNGEWHNQYSAIPLEAWGKQAELLADLDKDDEIYVECSARQDSWTDKNSGEKRYRLKFRIIQCGNIKRAQHQTSITDYTTESDTREPATVEPTEEHSDIPF